MSFLLLLGVLSERRVLCICTHFCIGNMLCAFVIARLCTHLDICHVHILGQSSHRCGNGLKLVTLGFLVAIFVMLFADTATAATTVTFFPTITSFSMAVASGWMIVGPTPLSNN